MPRRPRDTSADPDTTRAAWGSITRAQVVAAAHRLVATTGFERLTIRALARDLGVAPMSVYRHIDSKADVLDQVVDLMLDEAWRPSVPRTPWQAWTVAAADTLRRLLVDEPAALHVYLSHPVVSPASVRRMTEMTRVLRDGLGDAAAADEAYAVVQMYTIGFAAVEAGRRGWQPPESPSGVVRRIAEFSSPQRFTQGVRHLLDGITAQAALADR